MTAASAVGAETEASAWGGEAASFGGALVNLISVTAAHLEDFEDWYSFEHFPERLAIPGFRRARRYVEVAPEPGARPVQFLSIYETDDVATLTSDAYLAALDAPTDWTRRVAPTFIGNERSVGRLNALEGVGRSARVAVARLLPGTGSEDLVREAIGSALHAALRSRTLVRASLIEDDRAATAAKDATQEGKSMAGSSAPAGSGWFVVAELHGVTSRVEGAELEALLVPASMHDHVSEVRVSEYRLIVDRTADPS
ncbi:hypothetical protein [Agrococcus citreus]|uniref:Uncharacterized protein n=1 Tax=Agrococcus citreus TaxID=84643 RepID=A0ABN1YU81_9MICO